jgi:hypothetical protein
LFEIRDDGFGRRLLPMIDESRVKRSRIGKVPVEATARNLELSRQYVRLEGLKSVTRERLQGEVDPVLSRKPFRHAFIAYLDIVDRAAIIHHTVLYGSDKRDLALQAAGSLAILVALIHGFLAEFYVFAKARIEPERMRTLLRLVWQASTLDWIAVGVLLIATPSFESPTARRWVVGIAVAIYAYAAIANALATRSPHPGWILMTCVVALAVLGL